MGRRSSVVERTLGKGEVESSILSGGTITHPDLQDFYAFPRKCCAFAGRAAYINKNQLFISGWRCRNHQVVGIFLYCPLVLGLRLSCRMPDQVLLQHKSVLKRRRAG